MNTATPNHEDAIAIVGMAGRFPGAQTVDQLWQNLVDGIESIRPFTDAELTSAGVDPQLLTDPSYVKAGTVMENADLFDADFFGFSTREAEVLDPQQRVFLEECHTALENAGYDSWTYPGRIGLFAGCSISTYLLNYLMKNLAAVNNIGQFQALLANDKDYLATRVSYKLNLRGPSLTVQSACSTSLVAVHLACESLRRFESDMCLAGGISVNFPQTSGYPYKTGMILSPDGHCRAFDAAAQGTVFGKGCAIVVLKRLADAQNDGDQICAVIRGSAINNDGAGKLGYSAPSAAGQADVIRRAQRMAQFDPDSIGFIEAHGTGTELGDPIETTALTEVFSEQTPHLQFCALGSIKTNIGHMDAAAGVGGLLKAALALKHDLIPPTLHFKTPNPLIKMEASPFFVNTSIASWPKRGPRRAGVNSFGVGGTNAHVCLEQPPVRVESAPSESWQIFPVSARSEAAVEQAALRLADHLDREATRNNSDFSPANVAFTLQVGRHAFAHRRFAVGKDVTEAAATLRSIDPKRGGQAMASSVPLEVVFLFPGQGTQQINMGRRLYDMDRAFRADVDFCCDALQPRLALDLREVLFPATGREEWASQTLAETAQAQPALFVLEYCLAKLYQRAGIVPDAMLGHSVGEYVAACLAGVFSLEDALKVVAARARLMQSVRPGGMVVVSLPEPECQRFLFDGLSIAVVNAPKACVVSGDLPEIQKLEQILQKNHVASLRLRTSHAFHSAAVDPILEAFGAVLKSVTLRQPEIPFLSNTTGTWISGSEATDPQYWVRHMRMPVRFAANVELLLQRPNRAFIEVGPGQSLSSTLRQQNSWTAQTTLYHTLPASETAAPVPPHLLSIGKLWSAGLPVRWEALHPDRPMRVALPAYPFERKRFWIDPAKESMPNAAPGKGSDLADWIYVPSWSRSVAPVAADQDASRNVWICLGDAAGFSEYIAETLRARGEEVIAVADANGGQPFEQIAPDQFRVDYDNAAAFAQMQTALGPLESRLRGLVYCAAVTAHPDTVATSDRSRLASRSFRQLANAAHAFASVPRTGRFQVEVITNGLRNVLGEPVTDPERATLYGICHAIRAELPHASCRTIDTEASPSDRLSSAKELVNELLSRPSDEDIAYRLGQRWMQNWEKVRLAASAHKTPLLKQRGVYLVTGGLGGIGLEVSAYLAKEFQAKLVLIQRTALPPRDQWGICPGTDAAGKRVCEKIGAVRKLEELGAEVLVVAANMASAEEVEAAWQSARQSFGSIDGVFHAAGLHYPCLLSDFDPAAYEGVLAPKVAGTLALEQAIRQDGCPLLVLFSSLSTVLSSFAYSPYTAANAYLDAFADARRLADSTRVVNVNWDAWLEVGMANVDVMGQHPEPSKYALSGRIAQKVQKNTRPGILPPEGVEALIRILNSPLNQAIVSPADLKDVIASEQQKRYQATQASGPKPRVKNEVRSASSSYVPAANEQEAAVIAIWQDLIGVEPIGATDDFFELGGHSLLGTEMLARLRSVCGVQLPLRTIFEATTPRDLAKYVQTVHWAAQPAALPEGDTWEELEI